jgi:hypothetical protein
MLHNAVYFGKGHADVPYTQDIDLIASSYSPTVSGNLSQQGC